PAPDVGLAGHGTALNLLRRAESRSQSPGADEDALGDLRPPRPAPPREGGSGSLSPCGGGSSFSLSPCGGGPSFSLSPCGGGSSFSLPPCGGGSGWGKTA